MHRDKIGHLLLDLVEFDRTCPHYLILWRQYWSREEASTNLQTKFDSQEEQGSVTHSAQLQKQWKIGLSEQCQAPCLSGLDYKVWGS